MPSYGRRESGQQFGSSRTAFGGLAVLKIDVGGGRSSLSRCRSLHPYGKRLGLPSGAEEQGVVQEWRGLLGLFQETKAQVPPTVLSFYFGTWSPLGALGTEDKFSIILFYVFRVSAWATNNAGESESGPRRVPKGDRIVPLWCISIYSTDNLFSLHMGRLRLGHGFLRV